MKVRRNTRYIKKSKYQGLYAYIHTGRKTNNTFRYKNNKLQDGIYRNIFSNRDSCYGTRIFAKSEKTGKEERTYCLFKYAGGDIYYMSLISVKGQDKQWRFLTRYAFNPNNLGWKNLNSKFIIILFINPLSKVYITDNQ